MATAPIPENLAIRGGTAEFRLPIAKITVLEIVMEGTVTGCVCNWILQPAAQFLEDK
jgi:hypothetical protein